MKKHLCILYGCDDRKEIVNDTLLVCNKWFDSITILNSGPKEFSKNILSELYLNVRIIDLNYFLEIESCRRAMISTIPDGDWVMWLDADERPSLELLKNLDSIISSAEENKYNVIRFIWAEHTEGIPIPVKMPIPTTHEEFQEGGSHSYFMPFRFLKKQPDMQVSSNFGAHELFTLIDQKVMFSPHMVHHMKSHLQYYQSVVFSGFLNPFVHVNCSDISKLKECVGLPEYVRLTELQKKYKTFTSTDLVRKIKIDRDSEFISDLYALFMSFPMEDVNSGLGQQHNEKYITFKFMRIFAEKYNLNVESPHFRCGLSCCNYNGIQL